MSTSGSTSNQLLKKANIPPAPSHLDAPFPDLRSRFVRILNGDPVALPTRRRTDVVLPYSSHRAPQRVRLRFRLASGFVGLLFLISLLELMQFPLFLLASVAASEETRRMAMLNQALETVYADLYDPASPFYSSPGF